MTIPSMQVARRLFAIGALVLLIVIASAAGASAAGPQWRLWIDAPDFVTAGEQIRIRGAVENVGDVPLSGDIRITGEFDASITPADPQVEGASCSMSGNSCTVSVDGLPPGGQLRFSYTPTVDGGATGTLVNVIHVEGGGMPGSISDEHAMTVGAPGPFGIKAFAVNLVDAAGSPAVRASSAPREVTTFLSFPTYSSRQAFFFPPTNTPTEHLKDTLVHVPAGLVGNPTATPTRCTSAQLTQPAPGSPSQRIPNCPAESQVGLAHIVSPLGFVEAVPLYNVVPPPGSPAAFGFSYTSVTVFLLARLRASDNGIDIVALKAPSTIPISAVGVTLWGVPADSSHDALRHLCLDGYAGNRGELCPSAAPRRPFLRLPTSCTESPLPWSVDVTTYTRPDTLLRAETTTPRMEGCQFVPFDPSFSLVPTDARPHAPTGVTATVSIPQDTSPTGLAQADLRRASVTLPEGMSINPSSAGGLKACPDSDLRLGIDGVATCPDASKIGTATLATPLLDHPLSGSIYLRPQASNDPRSGDLFRIAVEIRSDDDGVDLKLPGSIVADPITGRVTTIFDALPQLPFSTMRLDFKSGPRAPLTSPRTCGTHVTSVELESWSGKIVPTSSSFAISGDGRGGACAGPRFTPTFRGGVRNPVAKASTLFNVSLGRDDADELFRTLTVEAPKGLLGRIKDVALCSETAANAGTCGAASLIGSARVGAGTGPNPFLIRDGKVFLTGPYKGAPYGLSVVTKAIAGPFDLGTVVVRAAVHLDRRTAQMRVVSEPLPTIVSGVPLNLRVVRLSIDRRGFMVNPTSCEEQQVGATVTSTDGSRVERATRFQLGNCKNLRFAPRMSLRVGARGRTGSGGPAPLVTTIRQARGQANLAAVKVSLPTVLNSRLSVVNRACTLAQFESGDCERAQVGSAVAVTPLLADPLRGAVYLVRRPGDRGLPDLMVALRGDVDLDVLGKVEIPRSNRLSANFDTIPDAPISRFTLRLSGGRNGPLGVVSNLCGRRARTSRVAITMKGQNGDRIVKQQRLKVGGCGAPGRRR